MSEDTAQVSTKEEEALKSLKKEAAKAERMRLSKLLFDKSLYMTAEYKTLIKHTGGLVSSSMGYAYSKGLNDALKLLLKEGNNEESVQS